jgi:hypothetical protein
MREEGRAARDPTENSRAWFLHNADDRKVRKPDGLAECGSHQEEEKPHSASYLFFQSRVGIAELQCSPDMVEIDIAGVDGGAGWMRAMKARDGGARWRRA